MQQDKENIGNLNQSQDAGRDAQGVARQAGAAQNSAGRKKGSRKSAAAFRTISEVAEELGVQQHVLRFWETKFSYVKPLKRGGGRRYYRPEDIDLLKSIHNLLYIEGYTIKGAQKLLKDMGKNKVIEAYKDHKDVSENRPISSPAPKAAQVPAAKKEALEGVLSELKDLRKSLK